MKQLFIALGIIGISLTACASGDDGLANIHADITSDYPEVAHLSAEAFSLLKDDRLLILDIRESGEFAVSHLPGAIQIDPGISSENLLSQIGDVSGKEIVVYCSVGRRSSDFADRMQATLTQNGAVSVANLENGIFGWHNEARKLVDAKGSTDAVHPYNDIWKRYVARTKKARYVPE